MKEPFLTLHTDDIHSSIHGKHNGILLPSAHHHHFMRLLCNNVTPLIKQNDEPTKLNVKQWRYCNITMLY